MGIFGHRDVTTNRGLGDPGDAIFERLASAGYEAVDFAASQDIETWKLRQEELNRDLNAGLASMECPANRRRQRLSAVVARTACG